MALLVIIIAIPLSAYLLASSSLVLRNYTTVCDERTCSNAEERRFLAIPIIGFVSSIFYVSYYLFSEVMILISVTFLVDSLLPKFSKTYSQQWWLLTKLCPVNKIQDINNKLYTIVFTCCVLAMYIYQYILCQIIIRLSICINNKLYLNDYVVVLLTQLYMIAHYSGVTPWHLPLA